MPTIEKIDRSGPKINSIISTNPRALEQADALDAAYAKGGPVGPLHGIPMAMKDQGDVREMPTTMGSVLFEGHMPERDSFVSAKLREAGVVFIAKTAWVKWALATRMAPYSARPLACMTHLGPLVDRQVGRVPQCQLIW